MASEPHIDYIIVDGIDTDFVTVKSSKSGFYDDYYGAWFSDFYECTIKNSKNQTIHVSFDCFEYDYVKNRRLWNIGLSVYTKRKVGYEFGKQTGKCGIESLVTAKKIIKYFLEHFNELVIGHDVEDIAFVWWDDRRRYNIYKRYLSDLGFTETQIANKHWNSGKCLVKKIEK